MIVITFFFIAVTFLGLGLVFYGMLLRHREFEREREEHRRWEERHQEKERSTEVRAGDFYVVHPKGESAPLHGTETVTRDSRTGRFVTRNPRSRRKKKSPINPSEPNDQ